MRFFLSLTPVLVIALGQDAPAPAGVSEPVIADKSSSENIEKEKDAKIEKNPTPSDLSDAKDSDESEEWYCRTVRTARLRSFPDLVRRFASKIGILRRERVEFCTKPDGSVRIYDKEKNIINTGALSPEISGTSDEVIKKDEKQDAK